MAKLNLQDPELRWVQLKWQHIRTAQQIADVANNNWKRLNGEINDYLDRSRIFDIKERARIKSESLPLKDALDTGKWHSANAQRHIDDLMAFLKLKELEIL